jgi:hypothetical protein
MVARAHTGRSAAQRCFIYLDPDYAGRETERYPWIDNKT